MIVSYSENSQYPSITSEFIFSN